MGMFDGWFGGDSAPASAWAPTASDPGMPFEEGWGFGPVDNPDRSSFTEGFIDPSSPFDTSAGSGSNASKWAAGLKELAGGLKGGGGLPSPGTPARNPLPGGAGLHPGTAGSLGTLLQLLAQRALMYNQAAHQGAVPARVQGSQGLLGL